MILSVAFLILAFSAGTAVADTQESEVQVLPSPSITLNVTNGMFYNLTYSRIVLATQSGIYNTNFDENHWTFKKVNNTSYFYQSNVQLKKGMTGGGANDAVAPLDQQSGSVPSINANVKISLNALNYSLSNVRIENLSSGALNYSFPNYSLMEITISIVLQNAVQGPGSLYLYQLIKSSNASNNAVKHYLGNGCHDMRDRMHGNHEGMQIMPSAKTRLSAFYWWNNTFQLNGVNKNLTSIAGLKDGGIYIAFKFPFNNTLKSIYQDPFFGVPGTPLFKNPVIQKDFGKLVNYIVIHAEYLSTGLVTGVALLGISYSVYRKRRF